MPVIALCSNIAWEILFGFFYPSDYLLQRIGLWAWPIIDVGILIAVLKFGKVETPYPFLKKWFAPLIFLAIGIAVLMMQQFVLAFEDVHGIALGWIDAFMMAVMFFPLLWRRNKLEGQSFYIAIFMLLGNLFAYLWNRDFPEIHPFNHQLVQVYAFLTLSFQLAYAAMVFRKCKALNINPWTRF